MSDEIKITNNENNRVTENHSQCFCQNKWFKKFLVTALGTFVGVYCALSLFTALHRPPMMPPCMGFRGFAAPGIERPCPGKIMHHHHFKHQDGDRFIQHKEGRPAPFEKGKIETDD